MEQYIEIPKIQTIMSFVATCIEATAREMHVSYQEVFHRMRRVGMIEHYIYPNYETLHTESREQLTQELIAYIHGRGKRNGGDDCLSWRYGDRGALDMQLRSA